MLLRILFGKLIELPIVGPHAGKEAVLLLRGIKPIGTFAVLEPAPGVNATVLQQKRTLQDISLLDNACQQNTLIKKSLILRDIEFSDLCIRWHIYGQRGTETQMEELAELIEASHFGREPRMPIHREWGDYLGYEPQDLDFWARGAYGSAPFPLSLFLRTTNALRRELRYQAAIGRADDEPEPTTECE